MNLQEFISHRKHCPICDEPLKIFFHSIKKQQYIEYNNICEFQFTMRGLKKNQETLEVGFVINTITNDFHIEFYTSRKRLDNKINLSILDRFKEFYENLTAFKVHLYCDGCFKYSLISKPLELNFDSKQISSIEINTEYFGLFDKKQSIIYRLTNYVEENKSKLVYFKNDEFAAEISQNCSHYPVLELPLINFVSLQETFNRLNRLIVFS